LDGRIDIYFENAGRFIDSYLLLPPIFLDINKHKKVRSSHTNTCTFASLPITLPLSQPILRPSVSTIDISQVSCRSQLPIGKKNNNSTSQPPLQNQLTKPIPHHAYSPPLPTTMTCDNPNQTDNNTTMQRKATAPNLLRPLSPRKSRLSPNMYASQYLYHRCFYDIKQHNTYAPHCIQYTRESWK
jgi:hypothetical protein